MIEKIRRAKLKATSPGTANRYMALVRAILRAAWRDWEWTDGVPKIGLSRIDNARLVTLDHGPIRNAADPVAVIKAMQEEIARAL